MFQTSLIQFIQELTIPLCCFCVWTLMALFLWSLWVAAQDGVRHLVRLHQIPCAGCKFFTGDYRLKCTVHPLKALSEDAIDCLDYQSTAHTAIFAQTQCQRKEAGSRPAKTTKRDLTAEGALLDINQ